MVETYTLEFELVVKYLPCGANVQGSQISIYLEVTGLNLKIASSLAEVRLRTSTLSRPHKLGTLCTGPSF